MRVKQFRRWDDISVVVKGEAIDLEQGIEALKDARTRVEVEGLQLGSVYEIVVFQAERHTTESHYRLTLSNFTGIRVSIDSIACSRLTPITPPRGPVIPTSVM